MTLSNEEIDVAPDKVLRSRRFVRASAGVAIAATGSAIVLLTVLHVLRPDLNPGVTMVSDYGIGRLGWVQSIVFLSTAIGVTALLVAARQSVERWAGMLGLVFLGLASAGFALGAVFNAHHPLHMVVFLVGAPSMSLGPALVGGSISRNSESIGKQRFVVAISQLPWISFVANMALFVVALSPDGAINPAVPVGLANRLFWAASLAWTVVVASLLRRSRHGDERTNISQ
jgi:hypothetical protein